MGGGGGEDVNSTTYTNLLPTYIPNIQGWAITYLSEAVALSIDTFLPYTKDTYAAQNANEIDGIAAIALRGDGNAIEISGEAYLQDVFANNFLTVNPNMSLAYQRMVEEQMQKFTEDVLPMLRDGFAFAFGGSEHNIEEAKAAEKVMDNIAQISQHIYYADYAKERGLQDSGLSHALPYGLRGMRDAEILRSAGVYAREFLQGQYTNAWNLWNENQILPMRNLDILGNAVRTILGTQRMASAKYYKPPVFAQIAGAAMAGTALLKVFAGTTKNTYVNPAGGGERRTDATSSLLDVYFNKSLDMTHGQYHDNMPTSNQLITNDMASVPQETMQANNSNIWGEG